MTNEPPDEDCDQLESTYYDEEFVKAIRDLGGSATIFAIIEAVGAPFPVTYDRLNRLMLGTKSSTSSRMDRSCGRSLMTMTMPTPPRVNA